MTLAEWRFSALLAWQDAFIRWTTVLAATVTLAMSVFVLLKLIPEGVRSGTVTMHYSIYLGIDDVRSWPWLFEIPAGLMAVLLVNTAVSFGLYKSDVLAARTFAGIALSIISIASIGSFFLVLINL